MALRSLGLQASPRVTAQLLPDRRVWRAAATHRPVLGLLPTASKTIPPRVPDVNESTLRSAYSAWSGRGRTATFTSAFSRLASAILTTQLYFPGEKANAWDGLFERALLMHSAADAALLTSSFNFVLRVNPR